MVGVETLDFRLIVIYTVDMFSDDPTTQRILREMADFYDELDKKNQEAKDAFESEFHKQFVVLTPTTNKKFVLWGIVYTRYEAVKKEFINIHKSGVLEVTDPVRHFMMHEYRAGKVLERLTEEDYLEKLGD